MMKNMNMGKDDASRNLIVNYLPPTYDEKRFKDLFSSYGTVEKIKLITDPVSGASRCYGFVVMSTLHEAQRAIRELSGFDISGKKLRVAYAQPSAINGAPSPSINVFISGFGSTLNEHQLREMAKPHGEILEVKLLDLGKHPRGVGFVRFSNVSQAEACVRNLNGYEMPSPTGPITLAVKFAERKQSKGSNMSRQHQHPSMLGFPFALPHDQNKQFMGSKGFGAGAPSTIFVHGISGAAESDVLQSVYSIFGSIGRIVKVDIPKHATGEPRNFCFIHFADFAAAQAALSFNGQVIAGRQLQVRYK
eukprot:TRINITY_DN43148_c0_g1_i1.p1 TRINITY_DN43148_c0_g1~~TRINITY_DN43148_c0_g1_i1.p1  ORF type:complete len:305 (+),score=102.43 TRINITY_DN43148_c0_g1_i1:44-958(+)